MAFSMLAGMRRKSVDSDRAVRTAILDATRRLLASRNFDEISVADILGEAGVARGSFYFYFSRKQDVLAELVRAAIAGGQVAGRTWLDHEGAGDRRAAVRRSIADGAKLWAEQAPVLRAVVENSHTDPELARLWRGLMAQFTATTVERIEADRAAGAITTELDSTTLAATLTWLGERLYYLAALGEPPFDDQDKLVDALTHAWLAMLYGPSGR
jgi:AcrR family transcriptional regulator